MLVRKQGGSVDIELSQKMADSAIVPPQKAKKALQQNQEALDALQQQIDDQQRRSQVQLEKTLKLQRQLHVSSVRASAQDYKFGV